MVVIAVDPGRALLKADVVEALKAGTVNLCYCVVRY